MENIVKVDHGLFAPDCIRTLSGKYVNVFDPKPEMFCIEDIAHALSKQPRFGGHLKYSFSVAEHLVNCAHAVSGDFSLKYAALMHDVSEAYLMDMPKPIKKRLPDYIALENSLMEFLSGVFGFSWPLPKEVKEIDDIMLTIEWAELMIGNINNIQLKSSRQAKEDFLFAYDLYKP